MSHTTTTSGPTTEAPWKSLFVSHLGKMGSSPEMTVATVNPKGMPRTRFCIHRGFWSSPLPENKHNTHTPNPHVYDSDCPTFTTDARMSKVHDIFASGKGHGTLEQARSGTGGGGYVEATYWAKEAGFQWRITGKCWIIGADDVESPGDDDQQNSGTVTVKAELGRYMRPASSGDTQGKDWSWRNEVLMHFANLSPGMRGSFMNPPPGVPQSDKSQVSPGEKLGQKADQELDKEDLARKNFRVAVVAPEVVEMWDGNDPENGYRKIWTLGDAKEGQQAGEWTEVVTWP